VRGCESREVPILASPQRRGGGVEGPTVLASQVMSGAAASSSDVTRRSQSGLCSQGSSGWRRKTVKRFSRSRSRRG